MGGHTILALFLAIKREIRVLLRPLTGRTLIEDTDLHFHIFRVKILINFFKFPLKQLQDCQLHCYAVIYSLYNVYMYIYKNKIYNVTDEINTMKIVRAMLNIIMSLYCILVINMYLNALLWISFP